VLLAWNVVSAGLVQLERQRGIRGQTRAALLRHPAPQHQPDQPADPCNTPVRAPSRG
jgi:hypothetical protein